MTDVTQPNWRKVSQNLRKQATELQKLVEKEPAERGRAIGSAGIVLAALANAIDDGMS